MQYALSDAQARLAQELISLTKDSCHEDYRNEHDAEILRLRYLLGLPPDESGPICRKFFDEE